VGFGWRFSAPSTRHTERASIMAKRLPNKRRRQTKKPLTNEELHQSKCVDGQKHNIWVGMTGDMKPQFCVKCHKWSNEFPLDLEDL